MFWRRYETRDWSSDERAWMSRLVTRCFGIITRFRNDVDGLTSTEKRDRRSPIAPQTSAAFVFTPLKVLRDQLLLVLGLEAKIF